MSGKNLISILVEIFDNKAVHAVSIAAQASLQEANTRRAAGDPQWWKLRESAVLSVGLIAELLPVMHTFSSSPHWLHIPKIDHRHTGTHSHLTLLSSTNHCFALQISNIYATRPF